MSALVSGFKKYIKSYIKEYFKANKKVIIIFGTMLLQIFMVFSLILIYAYSGIYKYFPQQINDVIVRTALMYLLIMPILLIAFITYIRLTLTAGYVPRMKFKLKMLSTADMVLKSLLFTLFFVTFMIRIPVLSPLIREVTIVMVGYKYAVMYKIITYTLTGFYIKTYFSLHTFGPYAFGLACQVALEGKYTIPAINYTYQFYNVTEYYSANETSVNVLSKEINKTKYMLCKYVESHEFLNIIYIIIVIALTFVEPLFVSIGTRVAVRMFVEGVLKRFDPSCVQILMR